MTEKVKGLTSAVAKDLLKKFGENVLPEKKQKSNFEHFIEQFTSPLIYILAIAGLITFILKEYTDTVVIFSAVFINTILGYYQEVKAEKALLALQNILSPTIKVIRDGAVGIIDTKLLVPGDIVILNQGDRVPADGRLIEAVSFSTNEAILTGESMPVTKRVEDRRLKTESRKTKSEHMVFMGTTVVNGRGKFIITTTGEETKMGKIAEELQTLEDAKTPLQVRISQLAKILAIVVLTLSVVIFITGIQSGRSFNEMFTTSVALAVAAIPEGMVISLTVILAIGMQRILKRKALVRKLVAAETLGSVTVIATDKTGTLTEGQMRVSRSDVTDKTLAVKTVVYANNIDDPIEIALWEWAQKSGVDPQNMQDKSTRQYEVPFNSDNKYMSVTINNVVYVKGAPEIVLKMTHVSGTKYKKEKAKVEEWSSKGLRVIGLASGKKGKLKWVGIVGFEDPVRKDIGSVFKKCDKAGIKIIMITGDYAGTAESIWRKINGNLTRKVHLIDGATLEKMSDEDLGKRVSEIDIFARVSPSQKLRIVDVLKANNEVVALVGDGVNDAPALKRANIGIVVGDASDVAKQTADMVLLDSNFKTIIAAIEEGRGIFDNIKKVILYLLSDSFTEILLVISTLLIGLPLPMIAAQILWINLITDGGPAIALTLEPKEPSLLSRKPISPKAPLIDSEMQGLIGIVSFVTGMLSLFIFMYFLGITDLDSARNITFASLGFGTLIYVFSIRSLSQPIWKVNHLANPYLLLAVLGGFILQMSALYIPFLQKLLHSQPPTQFEWIVIAIFSLSIIFFVELTKAVYTFARSR